MAIGGPGSFLWLFAIWWAFKDFNNYNWSGKTESHKSKSKSAETSSSNRMDGVI
jgi:hypothetical protein